jgi:hypothetical protein
MSDLETDPGHESAVLSTCVVCNRQDGLHEDYCPWYVLDAVPRVAYNNGPVIRAYWRLADWWDGYRESLLTRCAFADTLSFGQKVRLTAELCAVITGFVVFWLAVMSVVLSVVAAL